MKALKISMIRMKHDDVNNSLLLGISELPRCRPAQEATNPRSNQLPKFLSIGGWRAGEEGQIGTVNICAGWRDTAETVNI